MHNTEQKINTFVSRHVRLPLRAALALIGLLTLQACSDGGGDSFNPTFIELGTVGGGKIPDVAHSDAVFEGQHFAGSGVCASCHSNADTGEPVMTIQDDTGIRDVSIGTAWESSLMANATRDPYWHAVVASELKHFPNLKDAINDTCIRCHAPMAHDLAKKEGLNLQLFDSGSVTDGDFVQGLYSMNDSNNLFNHAMDGVSCSMCHQIADDGNLGTDAGMSGGWSIESFADPTQRPAYGQYSDPEGGYMLQQAQFTAAYGAHTGSSESCGSCHNLKTNPVDKNGQPLAAQSHFAEQMIYTEWENSIYDDAGSQPATCQSCHMPKIDQAVQLASAGSTKKRDDFSEHTMLGANTVMQSMLRDFSEQLGISGDIDFDESIDRNRNFIRTSADVELQNLAFDGEKIDVDVQITNRTGHKLPSGYHTRRVYLHVVVTDASGKLVYENGRINDDGSIDGVAEDVGPGRFESHYDVITKATQVQVYQAITGDNDGKQTSSLLMASQYLKDNRLTPLGFDKTTVPNDVAVFGEALGDDDFNQGVDKVTYQIATTGEAPFNVLVELRHQPLSYGAIQELFVNSGKLDQVDKFRTMYDQLSHHDEVITTAVGTAD
ncbi:MAG: hypothetical protein V3U65_18660 [Granulosicoccaceae bacterium]